MNRTKPTLAQIRRGMKPLEKVILQQAWDYFCSHEKNEWPILRTLYRDHGKAKVKAALKRLGGGVGREDSGQSRWPRYSLTLLGALLTKEGPAMERLMIRLFEFQRDLFQRHPEATEAKSEEIQPLLELTNDESALLSRLIRLASFGGSYGPGNSPWSVSIMDETDEFPVKGDLRHIFESWLFRHYQRHEPVFSEQRRNYYHHVGPSLSNFYDEGHESAHPSEITQSLKRLRQRYPDTTKLGFLIMRFTEGEPFSRIVKVIKDTAKKHGLVVLRANDIQIHSDLWGNVRTLLHGCGFGIAIYERIDQEEPNANVGLEVGYLMAMNKPVLLLKDKTVKALQSDLAGKLYVPFAPHSPETSIPEQLTGWLRDNGLVVSKRT